MLKEFNPELINKRWHPFLERLFYRRISNRLTPLVAKITVSPNLISIIGFVIGSAGIFLIAYKDYYGQILGAAILIFSYVIDCVDGELARGYDNQTKFGAFLDTTLDSLKETLIFFALAFSYYSQTGQKRVLILLMIVLFLQRMIGRSIPNYQLIYRQGVSEIKREFIDKKAVLVRVLAVFFSEAYRSGAIWVIIFLGIVSKQIIITFYYFIFVLTALFLFFIYNSYLNNGRFDD